MNPRFTTYRVWFREDGTDYLCYVRVSARTPAIAAREGAAIRRMMDKADERELTYQNFGLSPAYSLAAVTVAPRDVYIPHGFDGPMWTDGPIGDMPS